jgi:hypothetical protein
VPIGGRSWKLQSACQVSAKRRRLVCEPVERGDVWVTVDRLEERIDAERAERTREPLEVVVGEMLIGEREDAVLDPRRADLRDSRRVDVAGPIDAAYRGSAGLTARCDLQAHVDSSLKQNRRERAYCPSGLSPASDESVVAGDEAGDRLGAVIA